MRRTAFFLGAAWALSLCGSAPAQTSTEARLQALEKKVRALEESQAGTPLRAYWKNGLRFASPGGEFQLKFGGRIQNDWCFGREDGDLRKAGLDFQDGVEFRRARFYAAGTLYENVHFKAQYEFAGGDADFKDMWVSYSGIPYIGTVKAGHIKEPFGLNRLTSSKYLSFLERGLTDAFSPGRNTGFLFCNHLKALQDRMTWSAGIFRNTGSYGNGTHDDAATRYNLTARITGLPWYEEGGEKLLHLGLGWSYRDPDDGSLRYRARPESHLSPYLADTGVLGDADSVNLLGAEAAMVYGSFTLQGEYVCAMVDSKAAGDPDFSGFYLKGSWFLTGETRPYQKKTGVFSRIKPRRNFTGNFGDGPGAWEASIRFSNLDLSDSRVDGGKITTLSLALNWYLNPNTKVMFNYVHAWADRNGATAATNYDGEGDIFQMRFQVDF